MLLLSWTFNTFFLYLVPDFLCYITNLLGYFHGECPLVFVIINLVAGFEIWYVNIPFFILFSFKIFLHTYLFKWTFKYPCQIAKKKKRVWSRVLEKLHWIYKLIWRSDFLKNMESSSPRTWHDSPFIQPFSESHLYAF